MIKYKWNVLIYICCILITPYDSLYKDEAILWLLYLIIFFKQASKICKNPMRQ